MAAKATTKSEILKSLSDSTGVSKKDVGALFDALAKLAQKDLGKKGPGTFTIPGIVKLVVKKKPATPAREGINPFTKQPQMFKAKPESRVVRARPVKAMKDAVK